MLGAAHWLIELDENLPSKITLAGTPMAAATAHAQSDNADCETERLWWAAALACSLRALPFSPPAPVLVFPSVARYPFVPPGVHIPGPCVEDVLCAMCLSRLSNQG